jgi:FtsP/CotA-like multicopper oxidase with cupredoxin domain
VPFANPPETVSHDGVLDGTLTAEPAEVEVANESVTFVALYNGLYMPPVLRVQPGDVVKLKLRNVGVLPTNVHYHGLNVSPLGAGDNVFLDIEPGITFQYDMPIPADHPQGLFWYHPHYHPLVNTEIAGGLSGGMIIGNILAPFPELAGIPERVMLFKDLKTDDGMPVPDPDPAGPTTRTINGLFKPRIDMQPGQLEIWRMGNIGANIYYQLSLGGQPFYVIAQDGNLQNQVVETDTLILPPGKRFEALVYGLQRTGSYALQAAAFNTGPDGDEYPSQLMATVVSSGNQVAAIALPACSERPGSAPAPHRSPAHGRLCRHGQPQPVHHRRQALQPSLRRHRGHARRGRGGTIQNTAAEAHVPHPSARLSGHQDQRRRAALFVGYQDTVNLLPAADDGTPSSVTAIIPFDNPVIVGEFVYHCHIVQHADQGMMANIVVVDPADPPIHIPRCDGTH